MFHHELYWRSCLNMTNEKYQPWQQHGEQNIYLLYTVIFHWDYWTNPVWRRSVCLFRTHNSSFQRLEVQESWWTPQIKSGSCCWRTHFFLTLVLAWVHVSVYMCTFASAGKGEGQIEKEMKLYCCDLQKHWSSHLLLFLWGRWFTECGFLTDFIFWILEFILWR